MRLGARCVGSDVDLTTRVGRERVVRLCRDEDQTVWIAVRPHAEVDPVEFYGEVGKLVLDVPIVLLGSSAVYGENAHASETDELRPVTPYGEGKRIEEESFRVQNAKVIRIFDSYGGDRGVVADFRASLAAGRKLALAPHVLLDFMHLDDCVEAIVALERVECGVVNLGTGRGTALSALAAWIAKDPSIAFDVISSERASAVADVTKLEGFLGADRIRSWWTRFLEDTNGRQS